MDKNLERAISLSLIKKTDSDFKKLSSDVEAVIEYVNRIQNVDLTEKVGESDDKRINVMREDTVSFSGNEFSDRMLKQGPSVFGRFFKVKKIL